MRTSFETTMNRNSSPDRVTIDDLARAEHDVESSWVIRRPLVAWIEDNVKFTLEEKYKYF